MSSLGALEEVGGRKVFTGSSGISGKDIVEARTASIQKRIDTDTKNVEAADKTLSAFVEMADLLNDLKKAADALRNPSAGDSSAEANAFKAMQTLMLSSDPINSPAANYVNIIASNGTLPGKYSLQVSNLAVAKSDIYTGFTSSTTDVTNGGLGGAGLFTPGTFQLNGHTIAIAAGDTLNSIAYKINSKSSETGVSASIQKISDTNYILQITSNQTGTENEFQLVDDGPGVTSNLTKDTIHSLTAQDANFTFNGQPITRSTNVVTDLFPNQNFTLELFNSTPNGVTLTLDIVPNTSAAKQSIIDFMAKYNLVMAFAYKQRDRDPTKQGAYKDTAILAKEPEFFSTISKLTTQMTSSVTGLTAGSKSSLRQIGLILSNSSGNLNDKEKTPANNILSFPNDDPTILNNSLSKSLQEVSNIFEFNFSSSSNDIYVMQTSNNITTTNFSLDIDTTRPNVIINGNSVQDRVRVICGGEIYRPKYDPALMVIEGEAGSPIDGLKIKYTGNTAQTINVSLSQGIADRIYNYINELTKKEQPYVNDLTKEGAIQYDNYGNIKKKISNVEGTIFMAADRIRTKQKLFKENIDRQNKILETKREKYLKEHARNEAMISKSRKTQEEISSRFQAMFNNNG